MKIPYKDCILFAKCNSNHVVRLDDSNLLNISIYACKILTEMITEMHPRHYEELRNKMNNIFDCYEEDLTLMDLINLDPVVRGVFLGYQKRATWR